MKLMCGGRKRMPAHTAMLRAMISTVSVSRNVASSRGQLMAGRRRGRASVALFIALRLWSRDCGVADVVKVLQDRVERRLVAGEFDHALQERLVDLLGHQVGRVEPEPIRAGQDLGGA